MSKKIFSKVKFGYKKDIAVEDEVTALVEYGNKLIIIKLAKSEVEISKEVSKEEVLIAPGPEGIKQLILANGILLSTGLSREIDYLLMRTCIWKN